MDHQEISAHKSAALIVGVTGMVGFHLAECLKNPEAPGGPWKVYGSSRRPLPPWFPSSLIESHLTFDANSAEETREKLTPVSSEITHVFWVALQIREDEVSNIKLNSTMLKNVLDALQVSSPSSKLSHVTIQTGTKHYMGPCFDPSLAGQLIPHETPFREDYPRLPYPNFYYAQEDLVDSYAKSSKKFTYSIHRASVVLGASTRSLYNSGLSLFVYASICKYKGFPFRYFGSKYTWEHFFDFSDARVLVEQHIWAAVTDKAKNEAFNCMNGDVCTWKSLWKVLCGIFDLEFVAFDGEEEFDVVEFMKDKGGIWDEMVERFGLYRTKLHEVTCFDAAQAVLHFEFQHVSSMNKSKEFGFFGYADTLKSLEFWVQKYRQMNVIP